MAALPSIAVESFAMLGQAFGRSAAAEKRFHTIDRVVEMA